MGKIIKHILNKYKILYEVRSASGYICLFFQNNFNLTSLLAFKQNKRSFNLNIIQSIFTMCLHDVTHVMFLKQARIK